MREWLVVHDVQKGDLEAGVRKEVEGVVAEATWNEEGRRV